MTAGSLFSTLSVFLKGSLETVPKSKGVMSKMGTSVEVFHLGCEDSGSIDVFSEFWIYHVNVA